ncbi:DUF4141 domain-containing protein [uncultured Alistipes sp.]|uniref:DUF4141 domain-containing protein n=1 Tax=uncultured Alistipes sp. TaxID=538949 RepID=UPI00272BA892|nr:DUF4141 domain-containing protein [uncultured Alistipes sp.]
MKPKILFLCFCTLLNVGTIRAQFVVTDPGNMAQGIVNSAKQVVEAGKNGQTLLQSFQETRKIFEQGKAYYDALRQVKNLVKNARKVQQTILMIGDITEIYVTSYQKMLSDPYFSPEELAAIAAGYAILLEESANMLGDLRSVVNENGLSMNDSERMTFIDHCYDAVYEYRALVQYYTNKNIGVSYLRAKKRSDQDRILALYGTPNERYW